MIYYTIHFIINTFQKTYKNRPDFIDNILQIRYNNVNKLHIRGIAFMRFKKLLRVALAVSMLGTSSAMLTANAEETTSYKLGDVNLDGKIDINDLNKLQDYIFGDFKPTADNTAVFARVADINRDGAVDENDVDEFVDSLIYSDNYFGDVDNDWSLSVTDATYIQKYLVGDTEDLSFRQILNGDYNKDNSISVIDATEIQKQLIGMGKLSSFPTAAIKADDEKYRKEYADEIDEIETDPRSNISFDRLRENGVYVVGNPRNTSGVFVRDEKWCYNILSSGQIWLWGCYSKNSTLVIPTELAGYSVNGVAEFFSHESSFPNSSTEKTTINLIKNLIIPNTDGYMSFKSNCFEGLEGLESLVLQEGLISKQFEKEAFCECKNLKNVIWPASMTIIPQGFFMDCTSIKSIEQLHLPESVNKIDIQAFLGSGLEQITIPKNIKTIRQQVFKNVPARTATFEHEESFKMDISADAFRVWGDGDVDKKLKFIGHKNSAYQFFVNNEIADYQIMINLGIINSMDDMPFVFNYFEDK